MKPILRISIFLLILTSSYLITFSTYCIPSELPLSEIFQDQDQWCWAACSQAVLDYYGVKIKQCSMANYVFRQDSCCDNVVWPNGTGIWCDNPNSLNDFMIWHGTKDVLAHFGKITSTYNSAPLSLKECRSQIDNGKPIIMAWHWTTGGGHALVIYGVSGNTISFLNPFPGYGFKILSYDAAVKSSDHQWFNSLKVDTPPEPDKVSVNPTSGTWTSSPQNVSVSCDNATSIYYKITTSTNGSIPPDPSKPTPLVNDGFIFSESGKFQIYAAAGQQKKLKVRFVGCNESGCGPTTNTYLYTIDLRSQTTGSVSGKLHTTSASGSPLPGASVSCGGQSGTTGADGKFSLPNIPVGKQTLSFSKAGYQPFSMSVTITAGKNTNVGDRWLVRNNLPGSPSVNPPGASWSSSPQNLSVSSNNAATIYYRMVNTYDGSNPANPATPSPSSNDGSLKGPSNTFQLYGKDGKLKKSKLVFIGCNSSGCGDPTGVLSYSIDLRTVPDSPSVNPPGSDWTDSPHDLSVSSTGSITIYYRMVNTYDGSTPTNPAIPTPSSNDGSLNGPSNTFQLYGSSGKLKRSKLIFVGCNNSGCGAPTGVLSYSIDLSPKVSPTIAQSPMSGPPGTTFVQWGTGFTPNSNATWHCRKPDGSEYQPWTQPMDSIGHFEVNYTSQTDKAPGTYTWWIIDGPTGIESNQVSYVIEVSPVIAQTPMSGPPGTTFVQWGTGFTPNSTATLHFRKPDGTEYPTASQSIDSIGHFETSYTAPSNKPPGTYTWWSVDGPTGIVSNEVSYQIE